MDVGVSKVGMIEKDITPKRIEPKICRVGRAGCMVVPGCRMYDAWFCTLLRRSWGA